MKLSLREVSLKKVVIYSLAGYGFGTLLGLLAAYLKTQF